MTTVGEHPPAPPAAVRFGKARAVLTQMLAHASQARPLPRDAFYLRRYVAELGAAAERILHLHRLAGEAPEEAWCALDLGGMVGVIDSTGYNPCATALELVARLERWSPAQGGVQEPAVCPPTPPDRLALLAALPTVDELRRRLTDLAAWIGPAGDASDPSASIREDLAGIVTHLGMLLGPAGQIPPHDPELVASAVELLAELVAVLCALSSSHAGHH